MKLRIDISLPERGKGSEALYQCLFAQLHDILTRGFIDLWQLIRNSKSFGRVLVNGREAKPSAAVKVGDELTVQFGQKLVTVRNGAVTVERLDQIVMSVRRIHRLRRLRKR